MKNQAEKREDEIVKVIIAELTNQTNKHYTVVSRPDRTKKKTTSKFKNLTLDAVVKPVGEKEYIGIEIGQVLLDFDYFEDSVRKADAYWEKIGQDPDYDRHAEEMPTLLPGIEPLPDKLYQQYFPAYGSNRGIDKKLTSQLVKNREVENVDGSPLLSQIILVIDATGNRDVEGRGTIIEEFSNAMVEAARKWIDNHPNKASVNQVMIIFSYHYHKIRSI